MSTASARPNIVFLLPDQLRADFVGCYGSSLRTPAIDGLAARGTRFETAISPSPLCVPARASMLVGRHAHATGVIDNLSWLPPDRTARALPTWPELPAAAGYESAAVGKMHFTPWDASEGFGARIIAEDKRHIDIRDDYQHALAAEGHTKRHAREQPGYVRRKGASINELPDHLQPDRWVAARAAETLRAMPTDRPFALMVGFPGPHCPYDPPADALARIDPGILPPPLPPTRESETHRDAFVASYRRAWADLDYGALTPDEAMVIRHHYAALVERLDEDVATILAALEATGRADNTVVVLASDHGDYLGDFGLVGKTTFHEPSVRIPLIVADGRSPESGRRPDPVSLLDLYPTLLEIAGVASGRRIDGWSLAAEPPAGRIIVGMTSSGIMARSRTHKLVRYANATEAMFDLSADPDEQHPLMPEGPARVALDIAITRAMIEGNDRRPARCGDV